MSTVNEELVRRLVEALEQRNSIEQQRNKILIDEIRRVSSAILALAAVQDGQGLP